MPGPTLRRLTAAEGLGLRVLTGAELLDRTVRWVFTTDLRDPGRYLAGGELVLTGLMWRRRPADSEEFVAAVAARGAVGVAAGAAALGGVPQDVVEACARHRMPLLEVPAEVSFAALTRRVMTDRWGGPADRTGRRGALLAAVAAGGTLTAPLSLVAEELNRPCWILSSAGRTVASLADLPAGVPETLTALFHRSGCQPRRARAAGRVYALCPLTPVPRPRFLAVETAADLDLTPIAADLAAAVDLHAAREAERAQTRSAPAARLIGGLLADDRSPRELADLLADLALTGPLTALSVAVTGSDGPAVAEFLVRETGPAAVTAWQDEILALVPARPDLPARLKTSARLLAAALPGRRLVAGVSGTASSGLGPREALQEARNARRLAALGPAPAVVTCGDDIDSVDLLIAAMPRGIRQRFRQGLIGALEDYDARHGARLLETLSAFLSHSGSWQRCAADLHVHVNTVRYRMRRVEQLTGRDLSRFPDRVDLYLALRLADWEHPR
ncbi:PucR family transcriptional regulator [Spirillospora sp. NPDC127200]